MDNENFPCVCQKAHYIKNNFPKECNAPIYISIGKSNSMGELNS